MAKKEVKSVLPAKFEPVPVTGAHAEALKKVFGPPLMVIEDGIIVAWEYPGSIPTERQCTEWATQGQVNAVRAQRLDRFPEVDEIASRCMQAGIPFPDEWKAYAKNLRDWTKNPVFPGPTKPARPNGI